MKNKYYLLFGLCILFCLILTPVYPEEVILKNGEKITGKIIKQNEKHLFLDIGFTILDIPQDEIMRIESKLSGISPTESPAEKPKEYTDLVTFITQYQTSKKIYTATEIANEQRDSIVAVNVGGNLRGSGFIITPKGHIITNHHVIAGETRIGVTVFQQKGKTVEKKKIDEVIILAFNRYFDVALLQIKEKDLEGLQLNPIHLADFNLVKQGDPAYAFGNPMGLERTISEGIVSTRGRDIRGLPYIQTTAPINPGNSGSPLINASGEVIGLVTYGVFFMEGLGFALPSNYIIEFVKNIEAFAYDKDNPNFGYRYCSAPRKKSSGDIKRNKDK